MAPKKNEYDHDVPLEGVVQKITEELGKLDKRDVFLFFSYEAQSNKAKIFLGGNNIPKADALEPVLNAIVKSIIEDRRDYEKKLASEPKEELAN